MLKATFGAGCFWHVEDLLSKTKGVESTRAGYTGGAMPDPTYEQVCTDTTGHAEAVEVEYDPNVVSYEDLLEIFWNNHDPTTKDRQGYDVGRQYRSAIFFHSDSQKESATKSRDDLERSGRHSSPVVTEIVQSGKFYPAEEYHQKYLKKKGY